jgi:hypothetical protein
MSEPMPGDMPAQQYGHAAGPGRLPEHAEAEHALPAGESEAPDELAAQAGPAEWAEPAGQTDPEMYGEDQPEAVDDAVHDAADAADAADAVDDDAVHDDGDDVDDDGPRPLGLHVEPTGHAPVDAQLRRLEDADHLAVSGHLEVYEDVHRGLRDTLTALDRPAPGPPYPRG